MRSVRAVPLLLLFTTARVLCGQEHELNAMLAELNATLEWNSLREIGVMLIDQDRVAFKLGLPMALIDYSEKIQIDPPVRRDGGVYFTDAAVTRIREALARGRFARKMEGFSVSTILIDPGHGGEDPGSVDDVSVGGKTVSIREKDLVLTVARELGDLLSGAYPDKQILFTRVSDVYVSLEKRAETANALLARTSASILYISIHANRTPFNSKASGFEVWYLPPEYKRTLLDETTAGRENQDILPILNSMMEEEISVESIVLARAILAGIEGKVGTLTTNRGLKEESWYVVRNAKMPAVLVEVGFLSNPEEAARLRDPAYLKDLAEGIYTGVRSFITRFEHTGSQSAR
jgi:N-acetylmuramoyl-L-alanine amidase